MIKKSGGAVCCVVNCENREKNTHNIKYYTYSVNPNKLSQRQKWIKAVNRAKFKKTLQKNLITCDVPQSSKSLELNSKISFEDLNNAMDLETTTTENDVHLKT
ncbi:hypothetical protein PV328_008452 [Microctonus aethiopoides]|uniref:THAP-type domain-containing protein n=1 Tax=Microctonus aethiopoides TaxID=144406 RepID=A0AA39KR23_9HYME|nr:hypothetical protein PV328_008452 [Microctonus aethiopoides]